MHFKCYNFKSLFLFGTYLSFAENFSGLEAGVSKMVEFEKHFDTPSVFSLY